MRSIDDQKSNRPILKLLLLTVLVVVGLVAAWMSPGGAAPESGFSFAAVELGNIEEIVTAQGTVEPKESVNVGARVSGQLEKLHVEVGDDIKTGDPIAQIDAKVFKSKVSGDEARLKILKAQKLQAEAEARLAAQKHERNKKLVQAMAISKEAFEDSQTTLDIVNAGLSSLEAQIEEAQSVLEGNRASLEYTRIFAPIDGTVVSISAKEGETLNANQTTPTIVQIANLDVMTVKAQVAEADISKIRVEMPVYFTTLGSLGRRWQGSVRQILPTPEIINDVVLYNVLVDVDNKDRRLMSGMTTQMFFVLGSAADVPLIPASALLRRAAVESGNAAPSGEAYIVRVKSGAGTREQVVSIGLSDRSRAQVISGLSAGDLVAVPRTGSQGGGSDRPRRRMPRI